MDKLLKFGGWVAVIGSMVSIYAGQTLLACGFITIAVFAWK